MGVRWTVLAGLFAALLCSGCAQDLNANAAASDEPAQDPSTQEPGDEALQNPALLDDETGGVTEVLVDSDQPGETEPPGEPPEPPTCATATLSINESPPWRPQSAVNLSGASSFGGEGVELLYTWSLAQPEGSYARLQSEFNPAYVGFIPRMVGTYEVTLSVEGVDGLPSCGPTTAVVEVAPGEGIHIELIWDTPEDPDPSDAAQGVRRTAPPPGADLDLHLAHPTAASWFDSLLDCFWLNPEPDWAGKTPAPPTYSLHALVTDDPAMALEDVDGAGPEIITLKRPEEGAVYYVGVHYWDDNGYGLSDGQVRVYLDGELSYTSDRITLKDLDMWEVATLDWSNREVVTMTMKDGEPIVIPDYTNSFLFKIRCSLGLPITPSWLPNQ